MKNNKFHLSLTLSAILLMLMFISEAQSKEETRIKIGVLDTGVSYVIDQSTVPYLCKNGRKTVIPKDNGFDKHGHGTNVISQIASKMNVKTHCIVSYKVWDKGIDGETSMDYTIKGLQLAIEDKVSFLNVSMVGPESNDKEFDLYKKAVKRGTIVSVAAGNDKTNLNAKCDAFPACYRNSFNNNRFNVVGAYDVDVSNTGTIVNIREKGNRINCPKLKGVNHRGYGLICPTLSGTSQATAIFTGKIIQK